MPRSAYPSGACANCSAERDLPALGLCWPCYRHQGEHGESRPLARCACGATIPVSWRGCRPCRQAEREAARAKAEAERQARRATWYTEPCRTCKNPMRARPGYMNGECTTCTVYRSHFGVVRPAHLHGRPPGKSKRPRIRECARCKKTKRMSARDMCESCYQSERGKAVRRGETWAQW